jgi:hypothetical protein
MDPFLYQTMPIVIHYKQQQRRQKNRKIFNLASHEPSIFHFKFRSNLVWTTLQFNHQLISMQVSHVNIVTTEDTI